MTANNGNELIQSVDDLHYYLIQAMKTEHATIPPYITALYSIEPGTNLEAVEILRCVAVEEMLHLTLAANVFNAVGGCIEGVLTKVDFVPVYPTPIPTGETDFCVSVEKFSRHAVETFLKIERSKEVSEDEPLVGTRPKPNWLISLLRGDPEYSFYSIGLFYAEIIRGLNALYREKGDKLFLWRSEKPNYT